MKLALLLACLLPCASFAQKTIHVPGDAPSIQIGIAIADDGDTVLVAPGWYEERIDFLGRAITVKSELGPDATRIDASNVPPWQPGIADGWGRVVRFISGEGPDSVLDGFTITGSDECLTWSATTHGGILCETVTIKNCRIINNLGQYGAGVYGSPIMENCQLEGNIAAGPGGGIYGSPTLVDCIIKHNASAGNCGGDGDPGGGVYATSDATLIVDCIIEGNQAGAGYEGGGVKGPATIIDCLIADNRIPNWCCTPQGGGVFGASRLEGCTIVGNEVAGDLGGYPGTGGGISNCVEVVNCTIWGNHPDQIEGQSSVTYSAVQGGAPGVGNISSDPLFLSYSSGDYRLLPNSPCINAGDPSSPLDDDGTRADMGAFPLDKYPTCVPAKVPVGAKIAFDHVGSVLAASGPYVLAGTPDVNGPGFESGAAFLSYRDGPNWVALPKLLAGDQTAGALFGASVAQSDGVAWIGAPGVSAEAGSAYVFRQQADGAWAQETKLTASDSASGVRFGSRVAVLGTVAIASAPLDDETAADAGAVYVFRDEPTGWAEKQKLWAGDGAAGGRFGSSLAISSSRALVGAPGDAANAGSAYVFEDSGGGFWQQAKLVASDASANEQFGNAVALDGDVAVVAARAADGVGAVYVFRRSGSAWTQEKKLVTSSPSSNAEFGSSVAISGNRILVGARYDDSVGSNAGAAYLFEFNGATWVQTKKYTLPGAVGGDAAGSAVALSGDYVLVGAEWADDPELDSGELWAFASPGTCQPKFTQVPGTQAQHPGQVTAMGTYLGQTQTVAIDGASVSLLSATDTSVTYQPQPDDPGFLPITATGSEGTAASKQQLHPSLVATTTGLGGTLEVVTDNGEVGLYVLAMGFGTLPAPVSIASPPTWYGVLLNPANPLFVISTGAFATSAPIGLIYNVPSNPALTGLVLYLQAWCQQGFFGPGVTYSFTNMASVKL